MPRPSQVHQPGPIEEEKKFNIVEKDGKWCLIAKGSGKTLGCHDSKEGAEAQERAVQANKHVEVTVTQMRDICPDCADKMEKKRIKSVKLDYSQENLGLPDDVAVLFHKTFDSPDTETKEMSIDESHTIKGVEIFASGEWNGDKYSDKDLDLLVDSFQETKEYLKPYLKLGHSEEQKLLSEDELPAAGWIHNVRRVGSKLLADFCDMPQKIYELVKAKAYARVSSEIFINVKVNGKKYGKALKAVALLGGETPAVQTLDDVHALYNISPEVRAYNKQAEVKAYNFDIAKEGNMPDKVEVEVKENAVPPQVMPPQAAPQGDECFSQLALKNQECENLKSQLGKITPQQQLMSEENEALKKENAELKTSTASLQGEIKKFKDEQNAKDIKLKVEKLIGDKKIVPSQAPALEALLLHASEAGVKKFKLGDKELDSIDAVVMQFIENGQGAGLPTAPQSEVGMSAVVDPDNGESVDKAVKSYMAKHEGLSYRAAYIEVAKTLSEERAKRAE